MIRQSIVIRAVSGLLKMQVGLRPSSGWSDSASSPSLSDTDLPMALISNCTDAKPSWRML